MPLDSQGKHRPNQQLARRADQMHAARSGAPKPGMPPGGDGDPMSGESAGSVTVHDHGDGTMHTEHEDGSLVDHPDATHMAAHLMAHHSPGDKYMAMSHNGMEMKSSHADENGQVDGPTEHPDTEAMADHMRGVMDGEAGDGRVPMHGGKDGYGEDIEYGV